MNHTTLHLRILGSTLLVALSLHAQNQDPPLESPKTNAPDAAALERSVDGTNATSETTAPRKESRSRRHYYDRTVVGTDSVLKAGDAVKDFVIIGGNADIDGSVRGDLVAIGGNVTLGTNAEVRGDLWVIGGTLDAPPNIRIDGERYVISGENTSIPAAKWLRPPIEWLARIGVTARPLPYQHAWSWVIAGIFLLMYILATILFPRPIQASVEVLEARPGGSFVTGMLAFMLAFPLIVFLVVSMIGIILVPVIVIGLAAAFFFGKVAVYRYAGQQFGVQTGIEFLKKPLVALILGTAVFYALYMVPILGFVVWGAIAPLALGAALLTFFNRFNKPRQPAPPVDLTVPVAPVPPVLSEPPATVPGVVPMRRVGFWYRFVGTLIDAAIVGFTLGVLEVSGPAWLLLWVAYHVAMWTWLGATIGGLAMRLRIVRTDGHPIDFATALVRAFSAFISAAVLFVGFFWAGWTKERQSWHDRIAGTVAVKLPRGVPALDFTRRQAATP